MLKIQQDIWNYYQTQGRDLPWRHTHNPYKILVSEIMLQQTQVARVIPKYKAFLKKFPTVQKLAQAKPIAVLTLWSGLGYNRRGLNLLRAAQIIEKFYKGCIPSNEPDLVILPGIGRYTARAVLAFAFNIPGLLIETNIRTVILSSFYKNKKKVSDKEIERALKKLSDPRSLPGNVGAREWNYALMDYGAYLKEQGFDNKESAHYTKQSKFSGSRRQLRGVIIKILTQEAQVVDQMKRRIKKTLITKISIPEVLEDLVREHVIEKRGRYYRIRDII